MSCEPFFGVQLFLCGTHGIHFYLHPTFFSSTEQCTWAIISQKEFKSWVMRISFALLYGKTELSACQIFCDLLLKSAFEQIFNVMQLILIKIERYIKWKYLIQKFHDICLSYYFNVENKKSLNETKTTKHLKLDIKFYSDQYQKNPCIPSHVRFTLSQTCLSQQRSRNPIYNNINNNLVYLRPWKIDCWFPLTWENFHSLAARLFILFYLIFFHFFSRIHVCS